MYAALFRAAGAAGITAVLALVFGPVFQLLYNFVEISPYAGEFPLVLRVLEFLSTPNLTLVMVASILVFILYRASIEARLPG
jgi:hypothetical protein